MEQHTKVQLYVYLGTLLLTLAIGLGVSHIYHDKPLSSTDPTTITKHRGTQSNILVLNVLIGFLQVIIWRCWNKTKLISPSVLTYPGKVAGLSDASESVITIPKTALTGQKRETKPPTVLKNKNTIPRKKKGRLARLFLAHTSSWRTNRHVERLRIVKKELHVKTVRVITKHEVLKKLKFRASQEEGKP